jgi:hypothetical protein
VTVRLFFRERPTFTDAGRCGEGLRVTSLEWARFNPARGWQLNPVISREAAAMCEVDYKSAERRPLEDGEKIECLTKENVPRRIQL